MIDEPAPSSLYSSAPTTPRRPSGCIIVCVSLLIVGVLGALVAWIQQPDAPLHTWTEDTSIDSLAFSPDSRLLAVPLPTINVVGRPTEGILLYSTDDGTLVQVLKGPGVSSVAFSPDGRLVAGGGDDGVIRLWEVAQGRLVASLERHTGDVNSVAFSPDGRLLASGGEDGAFRIWNIATGAMEHVVRVPVTDSVSALRVKKVIFSPDGRLLGVKGNTITIWRVADGQQVFNLQGISVAFSPDGQTLLTGDRLVRLSDGATLQTYDLTDPSGQVNAQTDIKRIGCTAARGSPNWYMELSFQSGWSPHCI